MAHLTDYKIQRVLTRFPWRRRKPRGGKGGSPPIELTTREGQRLWADALDLVQFSDPGPALVCVAMHGDGIGHALLRALLVHHASERGLRLPTEVPEATKVGLQLLSQLMEDAGLDPEEPLGPHPLGDLLTATWAIAAATSDAVATA